VSPNAVELRGVTKRFGERVVLQDVALEIAAGERVALLGESGSGKSTLLNAIAGLEPVDSGEVRIEATPIDTLSPDAMAALRRQRIGFVFQAFHLLPYLDATANVALACLLAGAARAEALERARGMLEQVGMGHRARARPAQMSGGEQQRVALARALVHRPALVLADEPTGNLDPETAARALQTMREQLDACGAALLMVTHSEQAAAIADRRLRLQARQLVAS
jgi:putative ABC transport system ATP-binding protein